MNSVSSSQQVPEIKAQTAVLDLTSYPIWIYDSRASRNIWGNSEALAWFGVSHSAFTANQVSLSCGWSASQAEAWQKQNDHIHQEVEVAGREYSMNFASSDPTPGFLPVPKTRKALKATFKPFITLLDNETRTLSLVQVIQQSEQIEESNLRLVEMCNNHPMFQFLFGEDGNLLAANKRALLNMREHLGSNSTPTLQSYLAIGEYDGGYGPEEMYKECMDAIFKDQKPCHRFPQLRYSKRHPGKYRWVLYEMWPQTDPVTGKKAVLVCEQNISQVKALEEQFKKQNQRLEAQLEEALAQREPVHKPAIDIDTPADKTLKLLDKLMKGHEVSAREAMEIRDAILQAGDLRQPVNFNEQLMKNSNTVLDNEVSQSLIQLLSSRRPAKIPEPVIEEDETTNSSAQKHANHESKYVYARANVTQDSVKALIDLQKNLPDEVMGVLAKIDDWQFDAYKLNEVSGGRPLSLLSFALLKRSDIVEKFQIDEHKAVKFLMKIEDGYPNNPYHNRIHAADVLRSLHVLVVRGGLIQHGYTDEVALLACYMAAIIHDFEHKGVNNDYLIRVSDSLAVLYNDRSPMENHHLAAAFQLLSLDEYNFLRKMPPKSKETMRKQIIEMVLATDMKQHFAIHSTFQTKMQLNGSRNSSGNSGNKPVRTSSHAAQQESIHRVIDDDLKSLAMQVALKCADLGHLASPRAVHKKWVQYLEEEFFRQGDREKQNGLTVSPLMDREKNGITKSQVGFFDIVALPLFQSFAQAFAESTSMLDAVKDNYAMWREEAAVYAVAAGGKNSSGSGR